MKIQEITAILEQWAPKAYAEDFDNVGLLVGDQNQECKGVLITHDVLENVVAEAIEKKFNLIVTFHPIIFSGLKKITGKSYVERVVAKAVKNDIAIYALHTALDNHHKGVSHQLAKMLDLKQIEILVPKKNTLKQLTTYVPKENEKALLEKLYGAGAGALGDYDQCSFTTPGSGHFRGNENSNPFLGKQMVPKKVAEVQLNLIFQTHLQQPILQALFDAHPYEEIAYEIYSIENENQERGMGSVGLLKKEMSEEQFLKTIADKLQTKFLRHSELTGSKIRKVAVLGGSGSFAIQYAKKVNADAYLTADLKYHDFFQAERKLLLIDGGHYETEQNTKNLIHDHLTEKIPNFAIALSKSLTNPVNYYANGKKK